MTALGTILITAAALASTVTAAAAQTPAAKNVVLVHGASIADRSKLYQDLASGPFFGFNRPAATPSQGMIDSFWLQGVMSSHQNAYDCIKAFSETDFTEDLKKCDKPALIMSLRVGRLRVGAN